MQHKTIYAAAAGAIFGAVVAFAVPARVAPTRPQSDPTRPQSDPTRPPSGSVRTRPPSGTARTREAPTQAVAPLAGPPRTLLAWTPRELPSGYAQRARTIPGVESVAEVGSGIAWLSVGRDPLRIPVEVASIDTESYGSFVPPADRALFADLASGGILLGRSGAALRGGEVGTTMRFGDAEVPVRGVVADELIGAHEGVVGAALGARMGVRRPRYLLVGLREGEPVHTVAASLRASAGSGVRVRVREPGETPWFRHGDAVLPTVRLKERFGEFAASPRPDGTMDVGTSWVASSVVSAKVPLLGTVRCHRRIVPQLRAAFDEIARRGLGELIDGADFGGCYSPRFLNRDEDAGLSHHAWGVAFDVNVSQNPFGTDGHLDPRVVEILERWGFTWGGRWLVPDPMHFEYTGDPRAAKS